MLQSTKGRQLALSGAAANRDLGHEQREAERQREGKIRRNEHAPAVSRGEIREPPQVAEADRRTGGAQHERHAAGK